jgi:hypothetical protein
MYGEANGGSMNQRGRLGNIREYGNITSGLKGPGSRNNRGQTTVSASGLTFAIFPAYCKLTAISSTGGCHAYR